MEIRKRSTDIRVDKGEEQGYITGFTVIQAIGITLQQHYLIKVKCPCALLEFFPSMLSKYEKGLGSSKTFSKNLPGAKVCQCAVDG